MVDTGRRSVPYSVVAEGKAVCMPDAWGNRFPVSETVVELVTSDKQYISLMRKQVLGVDRTLNDGSFAVVASNYPAIVPYTSLSLELTNAATLSIFKPQTYIGSVVQPQYLGSVHFELGMIQTPWAADLPVIATVNGKKFKYPADLARKLAIEANPFGAGTTIELARSFDGQPDPDPDTEALFASLARAAGSSTPDGTAKYADELAKLLKLDLTKIRSPKDAYHMALEHYSNTKFNVLDSPVFGPVFLSRAAKSVFGGPEPMFFRFEGRAAFLAFAFAAYATSSGRSLQVSFADVGPDRVTTIVTS